MTSTALPKLTTHEPTLPSHNHGSTISMPPPQKLISMPQPRYPPKTQQTHSKNNPITTTPLPRSPHQPKPTNLNPTQTPLEFKIQPIQTQKTKIHSKNPVASFKHEREFFVLFLFFSFLTKATLA